MIQYFPIVTGSLTVNGDLIVTGTGSVSASLANNSLLLQGTGSVGFTTTASFNAVSSSVQQISASLLNVIANYSTTGSNSFRANQSITGSLVVSSTITAQTLVVQTVTSSIVYSSGSNLFGSTLGDRQTFTGSVIMTGSLVVNTTGPELQVNNNGIVMGNLLTDAHSVTGSLRVTGSTTLNGVLTGTIANFVGAITSDMTDGGILFTKTAGNLTGLFSNTFQISGTGTKNDLNAYVYGGESFGVWTNANKRLTVTGGGNVGIGASTAPVYVLEASATGGSQRIRVGTLQNNDNTARFEAITSNGTTVANSAWLRVNDASGFTLGQSSYTKAGGDSGNFANLSSEVESSAIIVQGNGDVLIGTGTTAEGPLDVYRSNSAGLGGHILLRNNGAAVGNETAVLFVDGGVGSTRAAISSTTEGAPYLGDIKFKTGASSYASLTTRMMITGGGNVLIGGTTDYGMKVVVRVSGNTGESNAHLALSHPDFGAFHFMDATAYWIGQNSAYKQLRMYSGGSIYTGVYLSAGGSSWTGYSDERIKDIIEPITNATHKLSSLRTIVGKYKTDADNTRRLFLIAQDVEKVFPEAVNKSNDEIGTMGIQYTDLIPVLVKAIQELSTKLDQANTKIAALEAK
jgi:hypothetical protein